jgi:hypothetical protein
VAPSDPARTIVELDSAIWLGDVIAAVLVVGPSAVEVAGSGTTEVMVPSVTAETTVPAGTGKLTGAAAIAVAMTGPVDTAAGALIVATFRVPLGVVVVAASAMAAGGVPAVATAAWSHEGLALIRALGTGRA